ncbi:MAG: AMP-binding protein [Clostridiales Family XIII bacterium]|nr:AMP-binding protein [Clostridiales Family XIII bacterium]
MDAWIGRKIGLRAGIGLTRPALEAYQLEMLRRTIAMAKERSGFYAERLSGIDVDRDLRSLGDMARIPFSREDDLRERGPRMACVPQSEVSRIVTLETSGSTGRPKRVFFTEADQELTIDFFHHGMKNLVDGSDTLLILLPCARPGSVGDLLRQGLERGGTAVLPYGQLPRDDGSEDGRVLALIRERRVTSLVGGPVEIARIARKCPEAGESVRTALLSTEYVSEENISAIEGNWGCRVFEHYGTTESGLGGAVSCHVREGCHIREADLLFEIIEPDSGEPLPDGEWGEIVFTTLTRAAMPFIRYRIGDIGRFMPDPCACGSVLKRLDRVRDRAAGKGGGRR